MLTAASIWYPREEGFQLSTILYSPQNFEIWTDFEIVSSHHLILKGLNLCGHLLSLCVQWPHFICSPSPLSCHMVLVALSTTLLCPPLPLALGWDSDPGWTYVGLIEQLGLQANFSFIIQKEPGCRMKPSTDKQSLVPEPWWYCLYFWIQACFPICLQTVAQDKHGSALCFLRLSVKQYNLEILHISIERASSFIFTTT